MTTVDYILNEKTALAPLTVEEKAELDALEKRPILIDEDCPEITPEMWRKAYRPGRPRQGDMVSMRIQVSPATLERAKTWGENYVALLGELLDKAASEYIPDHAPLVL